MSALPKSRAKICVFRPLGGYKGYGLGMMVEVFCGILAGAQYSNKIRTWKVTDRVANLVRTVLGLTRLISDGGNQAERICGGSTWMIFKRKFMIFERNL